MARVRLIAVVVVWTALIMLTLVLVSSPKCMGLHSNQAHHEERCLHKGREAKGYDLFAPTGESFRHSSRKAEKIKTAYSDLGEQDATSLDICKEALDHTVAHADNDE